MRHWTILFSLAALAGCHAGVTYTHVGWGYWGYSTYGHGMGAFSTSHGETGIVWNAPSAAGGAGGVPSPVLQNDTPVEGSDGSFGWKRIAGNADHEIHRVSEALVRAGCTVGQYGYDETKATCGAVPVLLRRDAASVYLLCAAGADKGACQQTWTHVLGGTP